MAKVSLFDRTLRNEAALGAYYTDLTHARWIGQMCRGPGSGEVVSILEPSFGDGAALDAFCEGVRSNSPDAKITRFGVELDQAAYENARSMFDYSLNADFLEGIRVSNNVFGCCFANPPYGWYGEGQKIRLESKFVEKIGKYMKAGGLLVLIVSVTTLQLESFERALLARFTPEYVLKFHEPEYSKWKQCVFIGRKKPSFGYTRQELERFASGMDPERLRLIPENFTGLKYEIPESDPDAVEIFTTEKFQPESVKEWLNQSRLFGMVAERAFMPAYKPMEIGNPPTPLKKDLLYLTAIAGGGAGLAGTEGKDLHLQQGFVKRIKSVRIEEVKGKQVDVETEMSAISLNIVTDTGDVIRLE